MLPVLPESTRFQSAAHSACVILVAPVDFDDGEVVWANAAPVNRPKATAVLPTRMALRMSCSFTIFCVSTLQGVTIVPIKRDGVSECSEAGAAAIATPLLNDVRKFRFAGAKDCDLMGPPGRRFSSPWT